MDNIFSQICNSDGQTIFIYFVITVILIAIFKNIDMGINILVAFMLSCVIILFLNSSYISKQQEIDDIIKEKYDSINPKTETVRSYPEIIDFLFSIQDFYMYNVPSYEDMVDSLENILLLYDESKMDNSKAGINYGLIMGLRKQSVDSLHSIIYNIPSDPRYIDKLDKAIKDLDTIIFDILNDVYDINKLYIFNNGYDRYTVNIDSIYSPRPENYYSREDIYTFDVF